jgi:hypothetical protein
MSNKKVTSRNFNKIAMNCVKNYDFENTKKLNKGKYKTLEDYQNSFNDILTFEKKFTDKQKKDINIVLFHDNNNDGVISAYYSWKYLVLENKKDVKFIGMKPAKGRGIDRRVQNIVNDIKNKNVLILDLDYNKEVLDYIKNNAKEMIVIDDHHGGETYKDPKVFVGENHAVVAYVFKFFYTNQKISKLAMYIDDNDAKLFLPFVSYPDLFSSALGFRFVHNIFTPIGPQAFEKMHELFKDDNVNFFIFIGSYYEQTKNYLKGQIAVNAREQNFQGYRVASLNFNSPALSKPVGRQIVTNFASQGRQIDFAVLWGYEFTVESWRVQLIDDHKQTKINLKEIAEKLGKISGHERGSGGHAPHIGNFYWKGDIFDLFKKKYI